MLSVGELDSGHKRRRMHQEYRLQPQLSLRFRTTATDVDADVRAKTNSDSDGANSIFVATATYNRTTYRITANIFQQTASTNTMETENVPTIWSPLRISGMITLFLTMIIYIGLHFLASKQRQERKRKRRQRSSDTKEQKPAERNNNITSSDDPSQKSNETPTIQSKNPKISASQHERMYTMIDVDGDDITVQKKSSSSSTPSVVDDSSCNHTDDCAHRQKGTTTTGDCSYLSIIPVVTTSTATLSSTIHSKNDNSTFNCSNIPNTIFAKQKKRGKNHQYSSLNQNAHTHTPLVMNEDIETAETSVVELSSCGLDQEQDIGQNNSMNNNNKVNRTTDANVQQSSDAISGSASVDDDEVYFYEQTLQFNHHAQRENITLHMPMTDTRDHINRNDTDESDRKNFVIPATSLWVSNEESFIHSV